MKSKALFVLFGLAAFSREAPAQIFSVNAVGYVNTTVEPGFNLVGNPLLAEDNSLGALFKNFQGGVPDGLLVYKFVDGNFIAMSWSDIMGSFAPDDAAAEILLPGDGVFVFLPGGSSRTLTFVGEVEQGTVCTDIPQGFSIKSSMIPQVIYLDSPGVDFPATNNDIVYLLNPITHSYEIFQYTLDQWFPSAPLIEVGQAFFLYHPSPPTTWCRTFSINNPV
jgi:hypothetical protein